MKKSNKNTMWGYFEFELFVIVCVRACVCMDRMQDIELKEMVKMETCSR